MHRNSQGLFRVYAMIHYKVSFDDKMRMGCLLRVFDGEAKRSVESVGCHFIYYATALRLIKQDFGNQVLISHFKTKSILDQPQLKPNHKIGLSTYHQQVKITNTWFLSMGYQNPILSYDNCSEAPPKVPS